MSKGVHPLRGVRRRHAWVLWLLAGLVVAAAVAFAIDQAVRANGSEASRPDLQRVVDALVSGQEPLAPGASAYVLGPDGAWAGSAGTANVTTGEAMRPDARLRIQSNSKTWLMAVILQLAKEGRLSLDDTVERWLPGLLPHGGEITIRQLMTDTSGLTDDDTMVEAFPRHLARVEDPKLRARLVALAARVRANPAATVAPIWLIRLAAHQPLLSPPGSEYHHSNIGWNIAGLIAAKAGGEPLPALYRDRIFEPLALRRTSYQPQGPIAGPHAEGYFIGDDGGLTEATAFTFGKGADGAIVTDAADEAAFLTALLDDELGVRRPVLEFFGASGGNAPGCPGDAFAGTGAGAASRSYVYFDHTGGHVAVLLLNGSRERASDTGEPRAEAAARRLYCAADAPRG
jgi:D-alanyl-D-alanine carboxypeptidase